MQRELAMNPDVSQLLEQIELRKDELLELTKTLIRFETPAPPARNTNEAQQFVADFLRKEILVLINGMYIRTIRTLLGSKRDRK